MYAYKVMDFTEWIEERELNIRTNPSLAGLCNALGEKMNEQTAETVELYLPEKAPDVVHGTLQSIKAALKKEFFRRNELPASVSDI
jgi:hypothetical protein